ncbi:MAG: glycosyltransferase family 2 protein [Pyrinomonadaceae bacterium]
MKLSVIIPAHDEQDNIVETVTYLYEKLAEDNIDHEILVVNDNSHDDTEKILQDLQTKIPTLVYYNNEPPNGFGFAVRCGLRNYQGDCVAIMMADLSDSPDDLVKFYHKMQEGYDCVFGNRWGKEGHVVDYPPTKKYLNRLANFIVKTSFRIKYNDCTNAFKLYRKETIEGLKPFLSPHFNLTLELPLKAIVRGYSYAVVPNSWRNRTAGESKLKVKEMGSRYFFILLYCLIEKYFSRGDFMKKD